MAMPTTTGSLVNVISKMMFVLGALSSLSGCSPYAYDAETRKFSDAIRQISDAEAATMGPPIQKTGTVSKARPKPTESPFSIR